MKFLIALVFVLLSALARAQDFIVDAPISTTQVTATKIAAGNISATGNVSANAFVGNGAGLTSLPAKSWYETLGIPAQVQRVSNSDYLALSGLGVTGTITATTVSPTHLNALNVSGTNIAGRIATTAQNSIQTMTGLSTVSVTGNISVSTINGQVPTFGGSVSWYTIPDVPLQVQRISASGNISVANISVTQNVSVTGNVSANKFIGDGSLLTGVSGGGGSSGPAFRAYLTTQSLSNNNFSKLAFANEVFDTGGCYDNATNYRFTPTTAGYYYVTVRVKLESASDARQFQVSIDKNGTEAAATLVNTGKAGGISMGVSHLVYMNGSTDYLEAVVFNENGSSISVNANASQSEFSAFWVK